MYCAYPWSMGVIKRTPRREGVLKGRFGGGVPPRPSNPDPNEDKNFKTNYFMILIHYNLETNRLPSLPFPWFLALRHQSLAFFARLDAKPSEKRSA